MKKVSFILIFLAFCLVFVFFLEINIVLVQAKSLNIDDIIIEGNFYVFDSWERETYRGISVISEDISKEVSISSATYQTTDKKHKILFSKILKIWVHTPTKSKEIRGFDYLSIENIREAYAIKPILEVFSNSNSEILTRYREGSGEIDGFENLNLRDFKKKIILNIFSRSFPGGYLKINDLDDLSKNVFHSDVITTYYGDNLGNKITYYLGEPKYYGAGAYFVQDRLDISYFTLKKSDFWKNLDICEEESNRNQIFFEEKTKTLFLNIEDSLKQMRVYTDIPLKEIKIHMVGSSDFYEEDLEPRDYSEEETPELEWGADCNIQIYNLGSLIEISQKYDGKSTKLRAVAMGEAPKYNLKFFKGDSKIPKKIEFSNIKSPEQEIIYRAASLKESEEFIQTKKKIFEKYGIQIRDFWMDFVASPHYDNSINNLLDNVEKINQNPRGVKISPEFLYAVSVAETGQPLEGDAWKESFVMGLHSFDELAPKMRYLGFLPKDFFTYEESGNAAHGQDNPAYSEVYFFSEEDGKEAFTAYLTYYRYLFKKDCESSGIDYNSLSMEEQDFWNYYYFNAGPGAGKKLLKACGINCFSEKYSGTLYAPSEWGKDKKFTAYLVGSTTILYRELGIFNPLPIPTQLKSIITIPKERETAPTTIQGGALPWQYNLQ